MDKERKAATDAKNTVSENAGILFWNNIVRELKGL